MNKHPVIGFRLQSPSGRRPSSRLRGLLPLKVLQQHNVSAELYRNCNRDQYKIVIFQKLYNAQEQQLARYLKERGATIILDMCDNVFFNPLNDVIYAKKIHDLQKMMEIANIITVSTPELAKYFCPKKVVHVRDGVEEITKPNTRLQRIKGRPRLWLDNDFRELVWFGVAESECGHRLMLQLLELEELFISLQRDFKLRLTVISNNKKIYKRYVSKLPISTRYFSWKNPINAFRILQNHEVCILPIRVDAFTKCKTHNRLSLALNASLGVVADSIPSYEQFSPYCFLDNWEEGLRTYLSDPELRQYHVSQGQSYIRERFTIKHAASDWWQLCSSILSDDIYVPTLQKKDLSFSINSSSKVIKTD